MLIVTVLVIALVLRALILHAQVSRIALIRCEMNGALSYEVRRRVCMEAIPSHVSEYPVPREVRVRVIRLVGVVLWRNEVSIALPAEACGQLGDISAQDYDGRFPPWLQLGRDGRRVQAHA